MRDAVRFFWTLIVAVILLCAFRALAFTIYTIPNNTLEPILLKGDRIVVNRWSYGLRAGGDSLFQYARILKSRVKKGDIVAFNLPFGYSRRPSFWKVIVGKVSALPGDTIRVYGQNFVIPKDCKMCTSQHNSPYLISSLKGKNEFLVPERYIIGRVFLVVYNFDSLKFRKDRWFHIIK